MTHGELLGFRDGHPVWDEAGREERTMTDKYRGRAADRYEVGDDMCGMIGYEARKADAIALAQRHVSPHGDIEGCCEEVTVYDWMQRQYGAFGEIIYPWREVYRTREANA